MTREQLQEQLSQHLRNPDNLHLEEWWKEYHRLEGLIAEHPYPKPERKKWKIDYSTSASCRSEEDTVTDDLNGSQFSEGIHLKEEK